MRIIKQFKEPKINAIINHKEKVFHVINVYDFFVY